MSCRFLSLLLATSIFLLMALTFYIQLVFHELPCALCFLQRAGFLGVTLGITMNFRFGTKPSHYAICLLSALLVVFLSAVQMFLNVLPNTQQQGPTVFHLHLYTWAFFLGLYTLIGLIALIGMGKQYNEKFNRVFHKLSTLFLSLFMVFVCLNIISLFLQCDHFICSEPEAYYYFLGNMF